MKKYFNLIIFFLILNSFLHSQDKNYIPKDINSISSFALSLNSLGSLVDSNLLNDYKCAFRLINYIKFNSDKFPEIQKFTAGQLLARPSTQKSVISKNGFFRIHYDTSGIHQLKYALDELLIAIDSVYNYEINYLGFLPPPSDNGLGSDNLYDIYIQNCSPYYGYTEFENPVGKNIMSSFMVIDNSYDESVFFTKGINAAKVTIAHEFFHAIQGGCYKYTNEDTYFYELSSTAMEDFVFDSINDYYDYMKGLFSHPNNILVDHAGYDLALWNIYLNMFFDKKIFLNQWQYFVNENGLTSIKKSIEQRGSTFEYEYSRFFLYNLYTGYRSDSTKYYKDGIHYPLIQMTMNLKFSIPKKEISATAQPFSSQYFMICDSVNKYPLRNDTIYLILVNTNFSDAQNWNFSKKYSDYKYVISNTQSTTEYQKVSNFLYCFLEVPDKQNWNNFNAISDTSFSPPIEMKNYDTPYPNPFYLSKHRTINFFAGINDLSHVLNLKIFDISMKLISDVNLKPIMTIDGKILIRWIIDTDTFNRLNSGVYFYTVSSDEIKNKGKFVILNDN